MGYGSDETTGKQIEEAVQYCLANTCTDLVAPILESGAQQEVEEVKKNEGTTGDASTQVSVPFFGTVQLKDFSLPLVTIILGTLD